MLGGGQADEQRYFQACVSCWSGMCSDQQVTLLKTHMQQVGIGKCLKAYYNGVDELRPEYIYDAVYSYKLSVSMAVQNVINSMNAIAGLPQLDPARFARHQGRNFKTAPRTKYKMDSED